MSFEIPDFLEQESVDNIHKSMLELLPSDIDQSAGSFAWDLTRPTALVNAEMAQMTLPLIMMQIWPQFANGQFLDYHAEIRKLERRAAQYAAGVLLVTGAAGVEIPEGSQFSTVEKKRSCGEICHPGTGGTG